MIKTELERSTYFPFGFHLSRKTWDDYHVAELVKPTTTSEADPSSADGRDVPNAAQSIRILADRVSRRRYMEVAGQPVRAGQLMSLGLLEEILRYVIDIYCQEENSGALTRALEYVRAKLSDTGVEKSLRAFVRHFPPLDVALERLTDEGYLTEKARGRSNSEPAARELALLYLSVINPALQSFREFFDDGPLKKRVSYDKVVVGLEEFFKEEPVVGALGLKLFDCLRAPMLACPDSLEGQLEYILHHWAALLPTELLRRLILVRDILREENLTRGFGPGPAQVLQFAAELAGDGESLYIEPERFTQDADWMSNVVLIAKSVYVWLDQLSAKYQRPLTRLDHIPDEELDCLAGWGFTGLWLIGVWERSSASREIKTRLGNPEAMASAYSLYDYVVAADLGGEEALNSLRDRAARRGIRLASDMVPNHMGIHSKWLIEHPDWFIQAEHPPFPCYQFAGPNLSQDERVGVYIEDGYWDKRDAAVVFKRIDHWTGSARYIYHGNDGTNMPWNDTAQLNYLLPEVREAVIQTILHVARQFPIVRFDAAMTLTKRHFQRLWFPKPGDGGAIPSRAEHGMTRSQFDLLMPEEFWREVVDRVSRDVPDTLLLAEAFWLMEGYFVRTLGMHRVYNSAFMNMLKMEENLNYRMTVKNVLEFSPEVLKRFVNFMNNPDERTAVEQFGKGDKYFGAAMLMVTMPGLPMFGHGQIAGFTEKYGMEYRRAYWNETVDEDMVRRHEREIFPLMRRRYLFSGVRHFAFYDFATPGGTVDENVFAYSNRVGHERAIVIYNNAFTTTAGWIRGSTAVNQGSVDSQRFVHKTLAEALVLRGDESLFYVFRDHRTGLEYIRSGRSLCEQGMFVELAAYQYHAFLDFREAHDHDGMLGKTAERLDGKGVPSITESHKETVLQPLLAAFHNVINANRLRALKELSSQTSRVSALESEPVQPFTAALQGLLTALEQWTGRAIVPDKTVNDTLADVNIICNLKKRLAALALGADTLDYIRALMSRHDKELPAYRPILFVWAVMRHLEPCFVPTDEVTPAPAWLDDWLLKPEIAKVFRELGDKEEATTTRDAALVSLGLRHGHLLDALGGEEQAGHLKRLFDDPEARDYLDIHWHDKILWLNRERMRSLVNWLFLVSVVIALTDPKHDDDARAQSISRYYIRALGVLAAVTQAGYQVEKVLQVFHESKKPVYLPKMRLRRECQAARLNRGA